MSVINKQFYKESWCSQHIPVYKFNASSVQKCLFLSVAKCTTDKECVGQTLPTYGHTESNMLWWNKIKCNKTK